MSKRFFSFVRCVRVWGGLETLLLSRFQVRSCAMRVAFQKLFQTTCVTLNMQCRTLRQSSASLHLLLMTSSVLWRHSSATTRAVVVGGLTNIPRRWRCSFDIAFSDQSQVSAVSRYHASVVRDCRDVGTSCPRTDVLEMRRLSDVGESSAEFVTFVRLRARHRRQKVAPCSFTSQRCCVILSASAEMSWPFS